MSSIIDSATVPTHDAEDGIDFKWLTQYSRNTLFPFPCSMCDTPVFCEDVKCSTCSFLNPFYSSTAEGSSSLGLVDTFSNTNSAVNSARSSPITERPKSVAAVVKSSPPQAAKSPKAPSPVLPVPAPVVPASITVPAGRRDSLNGKQQRSASNTSLPAPVSVTISSPPVSEGMETPSPLELVIPSANVNINHSGSGSSILSSEEVVDTIRLFMLRNGYKSAINSPRHATVLNADSVLQALNSLSFMSLETMKKTLFALINDSQVAITWVLWQLQQCLEPHLFVEIVESSERFVEAYASMLIDDSRIKAVPLNNDPVVKLYLSTGRQLQAASYILQKIFKEKQAHGRLRLMDQAIEIFGSDAALSFQKSMIMDYRELLQAQINLDNGDVGLMESLPADANSALSRLDVISVDPMNNSSVRISRAAKLIAGQTVDNTMIYAYIYHISDPASSEASPAHLIQKFGVAPRRRTNCHLKALTRIYDWKATEKLMGNQAGGLFKSKEAKAEEIGLEFFAFAVYESSGPKKLVLKALEGVKDPETKYYVALRCKLYSEAIDIACHEMKDQVALYSLKKYLVERFGSSVSDDIHKCDAAIRSGQKWKRERKEA